MPIELAADTTKQLRTSIKRYVLENLDQDIGDLKAGLLLEYCLQEICPAVYNQAIADAQAYFQARVSDLGDACYEKELTYWNTEGRKAEGQTRLNTRILGSAGCPARASSSVALLVGVSRRSPGQCVVPRAS